MAKADYKALVLDYLMKNSNKNVSRDEIIEQTRISKSRLSEVINSIKADGYTVETPPRSGIVCLKMDSKTNIVSDIKDTDVRKWLIIFLLSIYEKLTFRDLVRKIISLKDSSFDDMDMTLDKTKMTPSYDNASLIKAIRANAEDIYEEDFSVAKEIISIPAFRNELYALRDEGIVVMKQDQQNTTYQLTSKAPLIVPTSQDSMFEFYLNYIEPTFNSKEYSKDSDTDPLKTATVKIKRLLNLDDNPPENYHFGKMNDISRNQVEVFNSFITHQYKTNLLMFETFSNASVKFAVALLFYSMETSCFYILGKNLTEDKIESRRMDSLQNITTLTEENKIYNSPEFNKIYDEIFSSSYESKLYHVKVLFQNYKNVPKRFKNLNEVRKNSTIRAIETPPEGCDYEFIFEDDLRDLSGFARYLRNFGTSVLALEPPELVDKMLFTYNRIIEKYK